MKFNDNCVFKLYDLKKNSNFYYEGGFRFKETRDLPDNAYFKKNHDITYVYDLEEGITELLEIIYNRACEESEMSRAEHEAEFCSVDVNFTDDRNSFRNAMDALEIFRNKNISDLEMVSIYTSSYGTYDFDDFRIIFDEGVVKRTQRHGFYD